VSFNDAAEDNDEEEEKEIYLDQTDLSISKIDSADTRERKEG
jgi:hypothetical protein